MFHFLEKTYLRYNEMFEYSQDSILCFDTEADVVDYDTTTGKYLSGIKSEVLFHCKSVDELVKEFKGDKRLFKSLQTYSGSHKNGKLNIYCDPETFNELVIKLWKTIFPKLDAETGYILYDMCRNNALFQTRWDWHDEHDSDPNELHGVYWHLDKDAFAISFSNTEAFKVDHSVYKHVSIEYLIALHLAGEKATEPELEERYEKLYQKSLVSDINTMKKEMEDYLYELDDIWPELGRQDHDNFSFDKIVSIKPELAFLGSPDLNVMKNTRNLDLETIIPVLKDYIEWTECDFMEMINLHLYMQAEKMPTSKELIEFDLAYKDKRGYTGAPILLRMHVQGKVNMYFVSYFISQKENGGIKKFTLN